MENPVFMLPVALKDDIDAIKADLRQLISRDLEKDFDYLEKNDVKKLLKIGEASWNRYQNQGIIKVYRLAGKSYCKRKELLNSLENGAIN